MVRVGAALKFSQAQEVPVRCQAPRGSVRLHSQGALSAGPWTPAFVIGQNGGFPPACCWHLYLILTPLQFVRGQPCLSACHPDGLWSYFIMGTYPFSGS